MTRETHTAADAERAARVLQRDPAAQAYGDHLRRKGLLRPVEKVAREPRHHRPGARWPPGPARAPDASAVGRGPSIVAHGQRKPGHWLEVAFTPGGAAQIAEHPLPKVEPA